MVLPQTNCNSFDLFCFMYGVPSTTKIVPEILSGRFQIIRGQRSRSANQRREYKSGPIKDGSKVLLTDYILLSQNMSLANMVKPRQPVKLSKAARASVVTATAKESAAGATAIKKVELLPTVLIVE